MSPIAIVCPAGMVSGKEVMTLELASGLRNAGIDVHLLTSRWGTGDLFRRVQAAGFSVARLWLGFISATLRPDAIWMTLVQLARWPALLISYAKFLRTVKPSKIIHTNWHHVLLLWFFLRSDRDIYWSHEVIPNKRQYRKFFRALEHRVNRFVAVSKAAEKSLLDLGVAADKVVVIYNGIADPSSGQIPGKKGSLAVGIIGQVSAWKGHGDLFEAFRTVIQTFPSAQLHVFGKGSQEYGAFLRRRADELQIENNITWRGYVENRSAIYRELSILVAPSRSEDPLPTAAIEAAYFGIPVVATNKGGLPEIVEHEVTGLLVQCGDVENLASALKKLLANSTLCLQMGKNARLRASEKFGRDRFLCAMIELLEEKTSPIPHGPCTSA